MKRFFGFTLLIIGLLVGTVGIILCITIVGIPFGLPLLLVGLGFAMPGLGLLDRQPLLRRHRRSSI